MHPKLDYDKIAKALGAERRGKVKSTGGYFGALGLAAEIQARNTAVVTMKRPKWLTWTENDEDGTPVLKLTIKWADDGLILLKNGVEVSPEEFGSKKISVKDQS